MQSSAYRKLGLSFKKKISKTLIGCFKFIFKFKLDLVFSENNVCSRLLKRSAVVTCSILEMSQGRAPL